jgi:hypothetical protein
MTTDATPFLLSPKMLRSFTIATYITIAAIVTVLLGIVVSGTSLPGQSWQIKSFTSPALILFLALYGVVATMIAAGFYLWFGMLYFLLRFDRRSTWSKVAWFLTLLAFNSWAATVYFFAIYRTACKRSASS